MNKKNYVYLSMLSKSDIKRQEWVQDSLAAFHEYVDVNYSYSEELPEFFQQEPNLPNTLLWTRGVMNELS